MSNRNRTLPVALGAGGGLLLWYLLRSRSGATAAPAGAEVSAPPATAPAPAQPAGQPPRPTTPTTMPPPCRVRVSVDGIEVNGARVEMPAAVERCRASGVADVTVAGSAILRTIADVVRSLQAAGVTVRASPDVWETLDRIEPGAAP